MEKIFYMYFVAFRSFCFVTVFVVNNVLACQRICLHRRQRRLGYVPDNIRPTGDTICLVPYRAAAFSTPAFQRPHFMHPLARGYVPPQFGATHLTRCYQPPGSVPTSTPTCIFFLAVVWSELMCR